MLLPPLSPRKRRSAFNRRGGFRFGYRRLHLAPLVGHGSWNTGVLNNLASRLMVTPSPTMFSDLGHSDTQRQKLYRPNHPPARAASVSSLSRHLPSLSRYPSSCSQRRFASSSIQSKLDSSDDSENFSSSTVTDSTSWTNCLGTL
jgi:hypothetical protein